MVYEWQCYLKYLVCLKCSKVHAESRSDMNEIREVFGDIHEGAHVLLISKSMTAIERHSNTKE